MERSTNRTSRAALPRILSVLALATSILPLGIRTASAAPALTIVPITWNVIGLDSNDVTTGPNEFLSGAKICNTGASAATNVVATFVWDTANGNINLQPGSGSTRTNASLAAGACERVFFNIEVTRTAAAYNTARRFHISATADTLGTVSTPTPRELYVEKLVSQNRNGVISIVGPTTVTVGNSYTYTVTSKTATGGYEQLSSFLDWPGAIFDVQTVSASYSVPVGATNTTVYADACGWDNDPASGTYRSCVGPVNYAGGKAGGNPITTTYTVKVIAPGTTTVGETIYDFSGSSYHYNSDYGTGIASYTVTAVESTDVAVTVNDAPDPVIAGHDLTYTLHVTNNGPGTATATTLSDPLPAGTTFVSATGGGTLSAGTVTWDLGDLASGGSTSVDLVVHVDPSRTTDLTDTATVATTSNDTDGSNDSDTETTSLDTSAHLSIVKTASPDPVGVNEALTYTLAVANDGPSDARNVHVSDPLPAGLIFGSVDTTQGGCSESAGTVDCDLGTLAGDDDATVTIHVTPTLPDVGSISNTATVSSTTSDPGPANDTSTADTTVEPRADLSITKTDSADPVTAGNDVTYTITVENDGPSVADSVQVSDPLPAGTSFVSATDGGTESGGVVTWDLGDLVDAASVSVQLVVSTAAGPSTTLSNTATVASSTTDPDPSNDSATETTGVLGTADLTLTKTGLSDPVVAGTDLTYQLTVSNAGPSGATSVQVTDPVPAGTTFVSATGGGTESAGVVTWDLGTIANGASASVRVTVHVDPSRTADLSNTAIVSANEHDPTPADESATEDTTVQTSADVAVDVTDAPDPVSAGSDVTYTVLVTNAGPSDAVAVSLTDAVPAGTTFVSATGGGLESGGTVTWNLGAIPPGGSANVDVVVHVDPSRTTPVSDTATVSTTTPDPNAANDQDTEDTSVLTDADLSITKTDLSDPVTAGTDLTYQIDVSNAGPADATGVQVSDPVPAGTTFLSATGGGTESGGVVTWNPGTIANGGSATVLVTVHVDPSRTADLSNTATVSASTTDPTPADDQATETTTVATSADLSIAKSTAATTVAQGSTVAYTLVVSNAGPSDAQAVVVSDPLPAGTSFVSATGGGSESGGTVTWNLGTVAAGGTVTVQVTLGVDPGAALGALDNTASVTSTTPDPDGGDLASTASVDVTASGSGASVDLGVTKVVDDPTPTPGEVLTYTIEVSNGGPSTATGVEIADHLPAGLEYVSSHASQGAYHPGTHLWRVGRLAVGGTASLQMRARVTHDASGSIVNTASVRGVREPETNGANDASARSVLVRAAGNGNRNGRDGSGNGDDDDVLASLAHTGADVASGAAVLFLLAAIGLLALLAGRRRRSGSQP